MRIVTAEEAVAGIRSRDQVYVHCAAAVPEVLLEPLVARAPAIAEVSMVHLHTEACRRHPATEGRGPRRAPEMAGRVRHRALCICHNARRAVNEGRSDFVPVFLSDV